VAGERFCVRNSGVHAVVEAVGDHGCEYMTGGRVVILGSTGRNFAAGMSGGIAYVFDVKEDFESNCNKEMVSLEGIGDEDQNILKDMIEKHLEYTNSVVAKNILSVWSESIKKFKKVVPNDYKRMIAHIKAAEQKGLGGEEALMSAFEENKRDLARVSGN
jgi:glutamate synthase (ferredoxin)